jgi:hypothetical protein
MSRKTATGPQLFTLNKLGWLERALEEDGQTIYVDTASALLAEAVQQGLFTPRHKTAPPKGKINGNPARR